MRPNQFLQWSREDGVRIPLNSEKYSIVYQNFPSPNARNGNESQAALSTLIISDVQFEDGGNYTCSINGTSQKAQAQIIIEFGKISLWLYKI